MTELLSRGSSSEESSGNGVEITAERPLETRCDSAFATLLTSSHLHLLEDHPHTVYGVWSDLRLAYMNPAWFSFARRNGAEQAIPRAWSNRTIHPRRDSRVPQDLVSVIFHRGLSHRRLRSEAA